MVYAGLMDLATLKIRNWLVLALAAAWLILAPLAGFSLTELGWSLAVAGMVFAFTFTFFALGWIGGGDAKLAAATALWFGFEHLVMYLAYASIAGGILTILILQWRQWPLPQALSSQPWLLRLHDRKAGVPYGIALAIGALLLYPETEWMKAIDLSRFAGA